MKDPYKRWRDDHVFFLDEGFDEDGAHAHLVSCGFLVERFRDHFPDPNKNREHNVEDTRVIRLCNRHGWILLTTDANMYNIHRREIAESPNVGILATSHNSPDNLMEWVIGFCGLKIKLERHSFKKKARPWFACFNRQGNFSVLPKLVTWEEQNSQKSRGVGN